jgi:hypothetical protein
MNERIAIIAHVGHGRTCLTEAVKLITKEQGVYVLTPEVVSKPIGFAQEPFVITNTYEHIPKQIEETGFISRKERRKRERALKNSK